MTDTRELIDIITNGNRKIFRLVREMDGGEELFLLKSFEVVCEQSHILGGKCLSVNSITSTKQDRVLIYDAEVKIPIASESVDDVAAARFEKCRRLCKEVCFHNIETERE